MDVKNGFDLLSTIEHLSSGQNPSQLIDSMANAMGQIGFDRVNFYSLSCKSARESNGKVRWSRNYPEAYTAEHIDRLLETGDPVVNSVYVLDGLCEWSSLEGRLGLSASKQKRLAARSASGLHAGVNIPLRAAFGSLANLELASSSSGTVHSSRTLSMASIVAVHFFKCFSSMHYQASDAKPVRLTATERDVLFLLSRGHTKSAAGAKLGVTSSAVDFHCRNIMRKFSTNKMIVAVVNALQCGLLPNGSRVVEVLPI